MFTIEAAANILQESDYSLALTGAGVSKASGLHTYRGEGGLLENEEARAWSDRSYFDADPQAWYDRFWKIYENIGNALPSLAHLALRDMVDASAITALLTQNIDGLDLKAGTHPDKVFELHGNPRKLSCLDCNYHVATNDWLATHETEELPQCPDRHLLKPDIWLFGQDEVPGLKTVHRAAYHQVGKGNALLVAGTSFEIAYIAKWVSGFAQRGKKVILINPMSTELDRVATVVIRAKAEEVLPAINNALTS